MSERVFVAGGSGFVGTAVVRELIQRGYGVNALSNRKAVEGDGDIRSIRGDLLDPVALDAGMKGCSAALNLVGIIFEKPRQRITFNRIHAQGARAFVKGAKRNGVKRIIHLSALGTRPGAASRYHQTKFTAEEFVRVSGLEWTILQPSIIHGPRGDFMKQVANWARHRAAPFLFMPYFGAGILGGKGAGKLQPVFVGDVARAILEALANRQMIGKTYQMGGADVLTWPEMLRTSARAIVGKERLTLPIPIWYATLLTKIVPAACLPFNRDQIAMVSEDSMADMEAFDRDFGWKPAGFSETVGTYASQL